MELNNFNNNNDDHTWYSDTWKFIFMTDTALRAIHKAKVLLLSQTQIYPSFLKRTTAIRMTKYHKILGSNFNRGFMLLVILLSTSISSVHSHGRLLDPPNRSSIWRFPEFEKYNPPANYDDNQLYCGGYKAQYTQNDGKCGICGDSYNDPEPRDNEDGGKYGRGIIVRNYTMGQVIPISVQLTMTHLGYFELRLCADDIPAHFSQACYDNHLLELSDGSGTKYPITGPPRTFDYSVKLPDGVTCSKCVIQWHYRTGNTWGSCGGDKYGIGCGPQETFRGCADVAIH